ncbi:(2Fe-2S)-binding protein [Sulfurovum riftiae]|uniref:(2Fe-2S)-binding protein n=1 Tax=Sulfurovum riftiae TaxID=1630136 RepID=UPI0024097B64|nr:(2Fe-2S)-binding protein [Sulfurovum riftiae]
MENLLDEDRICYCIGVTKGEITKAIDEGADSLEAIREATKACTGSDCKNTNPLKRCCSKEIKKLLEGERKMEKNVFKTAEGAKIAFTGAVAKQQIITMVENCSTGNCECMSDETREKISNIEVAGEDGNVELKLTGDVTKEELEEALERSKVLNDK